METLEKRRSIINKIYEDLENLKKEDLVAISNFCSSISNINLKNKKEDENTFRLLEFYRGPDPVPASVGEGAIRRFNTQKFSHLQKVFVIQADVVDFLLREASDIVNVFLLEREIDGHACIDIAYNNTANEEFYYVDRMENGNGVIMTDFQSGRKKFEGNLKNILDINENPNGYKCPTKIMIDKTDFDKFNQFSIGKNKPQIQLITGINQDKGNVDFYNRVTLVMNFVSEIDGALSPDMSYFDTYHLCPPGTC